MQVTASGIQATASLIQVTKKWLSRLKPHPKSFYLIQAIGTLIQVTGLVRSGLIQSPGLPIQSTGMFLILNKHQNFHQTHQVGCGTKRNYYEYLFQLQSWKLWRNLTHLGNISLSTNTHCISKHLHHICCYSNVSQQILHKC